MNIKKHTNFVLIQEDQNQTILTFSEVIELLISKEYKENNVVIDLLKYKKMSFEDLLLFLKMSDTHRAAKKSFVMVNDAIAIDSVPDELIVVPTVQEAEDIIEMEEIERDLGF